MKAGTCPTRILFMDGDEASFQIWQCMARTVEQIPPVELFYAGDATEGLSMIDHVKPDVIVLNFDEDLAAERETFMDAVYGKHPPILIPDDKAKAAEDPRPENGIVYVKRTETLDGIVKTLLVAATVGTRTPTDNSPVYH